METTIKSGRTTVENYSYSLAVEIDKEDTMDKHIGVFADCWREHIFHSILTQAKKEILNMDKFVMLMNADIKVITKEEE